MKNAWRSTATRQNLRRARSWAIDDGRDARGVVKALLVTLFWRLIPYRCEAMASNRYGESVMDNPLSVYWGWTLGQRCKNKAVAGLRGKWGGGQTRICLEHAEMLERCKSYERLTPARVMVPK